MTGILLVGASGLAREVLASGIDRVVGIVDDNAALEGTDMAGVRVVGSLADAADRPEHLLVCIGPSRARQKAVQRFAQLGVAEDRYESYVAGSARCGDSSAIGVGSIVLDGVVITSDVRIGRHVVVMPNCTITHDDALEDFSTLAAGVALGGSVAVGEAAYLGMNASVRQGVGIGAHATVGMGAVVLDDVPESETWAGVPARKLGADR